MLKVMVRETQAQSRPRGETGRVRVSIHRYRSETLRGDYLRAGLGLCLTVIPMVTLDAPGGLIAAMGMIAALCLFFLFRTIERHRTIVSVDEDGIAVSSWFGGMIAWRDLDRMQLAYYSLRRDRAQGWMQLTLRARATTLTLDSRLDGFLAVVERSAHVARENGVPVNHITLANLQALGVT